MIPDPTRGLRDAQARRREGATPLMRERIGRIVDGVTGRVSGGGNWIGFGGVFVNPLPNPPAAFQLTLDVWLEATDATGVPDFSMPVGSRVSVDFSRFAWALRVVGAAATAYQAGTIFFGYSNDDFDVPDCDSIEGIAATLAQINVTTVGQAVVGLTAVDSTPLPADAARVGGYVRNVGLEACYIALGVAAVYGVTGQLLNPGETLDLSGFPWVYRGAVHGICNAGKTTNLSTLTVSP